MQRSIVRNGPCHDRRGRSADVVVEGVPRRRLHLATVHRLAAAMLLACAAPGSAADTYAVFAVADPPDGPGADVVQVAAELRSALRERAGSTLDAAATRARLVGTPAPATLHDAARARRRAEAAWEAGDVAAAARALRTVVRDLEHLPDADEVYSEWKQASVRLAYLQKLRRDPSASAATLEAIAALEPGFVVDEVQYPPSFRRDFEAARRRVLARGKLPVAISSSGAPVRAFVNGKPVGTTPVTVELPPGRYRVAGALGALRVPAASVQLEGHARQLELDAALAEALRADAGPALALSSSARPAGIARAGAALGVTHAVAVSIVDDGDVRVAAAALHDVRRGAVVREVRAPMSGGVLSAASARALAASLLTGGPATDDLAVAGPMPQAGGAGADIGPRDIASPSLRPSPQLALVVAPPPTTTLVAEPPRSGQTSGDQVLKWSPVATGALTLGLGIFSATQAIAASSDYASARELAPGGSLTTTEVLAQYKDLLAQGDAARTRAIASGVGAAVALVSTGVLAYLSHRQTGEVGPIRF